MKALLAFLLSCSSASAMICTADTNAEILSKIEKDSGETLRFVGVYKFGGPDLPMEITVSTAGTWSIFIQNPAGLWCFLAIGDSWQGVEPKAPGTPG